MAFKKLKRIGVFSMAKFQGIMMAAVGLLLGVVGYLMQAVLLGTSSAETPEAQISSILGPIVIVLFPIAYGIMGFVMGAVGAALYNLIAKWIGGIEVEFDK
jgi:hypothetical protein